MYIRWAYWRVKREMQLCRK